MSTLKQESPPYPLAPWAEIVPHVPPMTVDDLESLPDDQGWVYELGGRSPDSHADERL